METNLTICRLAESAQVNVETVRYYQRRGLMREPARPTGSVRRHLDDDVRRIRFIKRAQHLSFTLEEITNLLKLEDGRWSRFSNFAELLPNIRRRSLGRPLSLRPL